MSRGRSSQQLSRIGVISLVVALLALAAALNLQKFPGLRGAPYTAEFSEAGGLSPGNMVQIAGVRVGRVSDIELAGDHVVVHFTVDAGRDFGKDSKASVEVLDLLGTKFLQISPEGSDEMPEDGKIPLARTDSSYDIVDVFSRLTNTTEEIKIPQLQQALTSVADTMNRSSDEAEATFDGLSRLSQTIASRDQELDSLLGKAQSVSQLLADRKGDIVALIKDADLILRELRLRREAVHSLLVNTARLSRELGGLVDDNEKEIGPMLAELHEVTELLKDRKKQLGAAIHNLGPYTSILSNIIGTGPWFDAYPVNLAEFLAGEGKVDVQ